MRNTTSLPAAVYDDIKEKAGEIVDLLDEFQESLSGDPRLSDGLENEEIELMDECRNLLAEIYYHPQRVTYGDSGLDNNEEQPFDFEDWASEELYFIWNDSSVHRKRDVISKMIADFKDMQKHGIVNIRDSYEDDIVDYVNEHYNDYGW